MPEIFRNSEILLKASKDAYIEGLGDIYSFWGNNIFRFAELFKIIGLEPLSLRDLVYARMNTTNNAKLLLNNLDINVRESAILFPGRPHIPFKREETGRKTQLLLSRNSPIWKGETTTLYEGIYSEGGHYNPSRKKGELEYKKEGEGYFFERKLSEIYWSQSQKDKGKEPEKREVFIFDLERLVGKKEVKIPTNKFTEEAITRWTFKDQAENYGFYLRDKGIKTISVLLDTGWGSTENLQDYLEVQGHSFVRPLALLDVRGSNETLGYTIGSKKGICCNLGHFLTIPKYFNFLWNSQGKSQNNKDKTIKKVISKLKKLDYFKFKNQN